MAQDINNFIDPKLISSLEQINNQLIAAGTNVDKLVPSINALAEAQKALGKSNEDNNSKRKKLTEAERDAAKLAKQLEAAEKKLISVQKGQQDILIKTRTEIVKNTKATRDLQKAQSAQKGSTEQLSAVNTILEKRLKSVNQTTDKGRKSADLLRSAIDKNNKKISEQSSALTKQKINIRNYSSAIGNLARQFAGALGLTSLAFLFVNVLKGSFNTIREFTKENAVLAGVLGKQRKEIKELTNQAINLGSVYPVTASEVNKLQVSFARLGFSQQEIINLTEATIQGSIALNSSLDQTATLVGAVVLAYQNLGTSNATEIIDKITLATQRSSLSFSSLETGIPKVAGAADALNISLSTTLVHLGIAHDATLDASIAATSMRNIYLELSARGLTLNEALGLINNSSNKLNTSFDLFGKRGAIVGLALANNIDRAIEFEDVIDKAGGTTQRVAEEQMATLDGSIKGLSSSWEKFILGFKGSEGIFRKVIDSLAIAIDTFSNDSISSLRKLIEFMTVGIIPAASKIQRRLNGVTKAISGASVKDLEFTIKTNEEKLKNGSKTDKLVLDMLKNRLQQQRIIEIKAKQDEAAQDKKALGDKRLSIIAAISELNDEEIAIVLEKNKELLKNDEFAANVKAALASRELKNEQEKLDKIKDKNKEHAEDLKTLYENLDNELFNLNVLFAKKVTSETDKYFDRILERTLTIKQEIANAISDFPLEDEQTEEVDEKALSAFRSTEQKKLDILDKNAEIKRNNEEEYKQMAIDASRDLTNFLFNQKVSGLQREFQAAEGNAKKQAEISRKIAQQEKKQAMFNVAINTAVAVSKVWSQTGIFAIAAQIPVLVMGALQAGLIAAQPIPTFATGTNYAPGGTALVGEAGRELIINPSGKISLAENPALVNLERGSKVIPNAKTENMLNDKNIVSELKLTRKAIQRMPRQRNESQFAIRQRAYLDGYKSNKHRLN